MQLTFSQSDSASVWHAALAIGLGYPITAPQLGEALAPLLDITPVVPRDQQKALLAMLAQMSAVGYEKSEHLAERTLDKLGGKRSYNLSAVTGLTSWLTDVEQAYFDWHRARSSTPLQNEIATRSQPFRGLWDARGPGLMRSLGRITDTAMVPEAAEVVMVAPAVGGHGVAHVATNRVTFEAVLTNANESLPEVVRFGWLLGQLQFDLPRVAESLLPARLEYLAACSTIPAALVAAQEVELVQFSPETVARAASLWRVASTPEEAGQLAALLSKWWSVYTTSTWQWPVALAALEQMMLSD